VSPALNPLTVEPVALHARVLGPENAPHLIVLHGLLGTSDNWQTLARIWAERFRVWLPDARNHGRSPHHPEHSYPAMAADLLAFMDAHHIPKATLLGHSMGGKTALAFALAHPDRVERLIVADMAARAYPIHHDHILDALREAPAATAKERSEIEDFLLARLADPTVVAFLMKGLSRRAEGGFVWKSNLPVLQAHLAEIVAGIPLSFNTLPTLLIYGGQSTYVGPDDVKDFEHHFMQLETHCIQRAGHWLHAEFPEEFASTVSAFLS